MPAVVTDDDSGDAAERLKAQIAEQHSEIARLTAELAMAAHTDPLTGLANRTRLDEDLATMQGRMDRYGHRACVAVFDVDHFKRINDKFGHPAGDTILREVAAILAGALRAGDVAYRSGGQEFVALFPEIDATRGRSAAERVRHLVEKAAISHPGSPYGVITVSAGVAASAGHPGVPIAELIVQAERGLRAAKATGRNRVQIDPGENTATGTLLGKETHAGAGHTPSIGALSH